MIRPFPAPQAGSFAVRRDFFRLKAHPDVHFQGGQDYAHGISSMAQPIMVDRHLWIEVAEYLAVAIGVALLALVIADELGAPLWGRLTSFHLR